MRSMKPKEFDSPISLLAPLAILCFSLATPLYADIDLDGNGLGDVWEQQFKVENLLPGDDNDGDGKTNLEENLAGTNPLDRASILRIESASFTNEKLVLTWPSRAGKRYQVEVTTNFVDWKVAAPTLNPLHPIPPRHESAPGNQISYQ